MGIVTIVAILTSIFIILFLLGLLLPERKDESPEKENNEE